MKTTIKLTALLLLATTGLFAATPAKTLKAAAPSNEATVTISSMTNKGVAVKASEKSVVMIYDQDKNVLRKDVLAANGTMEKGYVLNKLDNGKYTIEVTSNKQTVKKDIYIYNEGKDKTFIIQQ